MLAAEAVPLKVAALCEVLTGLIHIDLLPEEGCVSLTTTFGSVFINGASKLPVTSRLPILAAPERRKNF